jgi:hypothetical protein
MSLFRCQNRFLTKWVGDGNDAASPDDHWARDCCLGSTYIGQQSKKIVCPDFHNGVIKIQNGDTLLLTPRGASVVACLRKDRGVQGQGTEANVPAAHEDPITAYIVRS